MTRLPFILIDDVMVRVDPVCPPLVVVDPVALEAGAGHGTLVTPYNLTSSLAVTSIKTSQPCSQRPLEMKTLQLSL